ncbi:hypothetical protein ES332_A06G192100v1 [Gossypium tomentosum]|uniref:Uncharacterized protein n=1 Tax=Gossypium tomentosum TaxID=34277 RepID=A0A5D2Q5P3_GOSTO|nr:hypothetical protein ES332_A06G192100v1 [Gossypium tomentosum]
MSKREIEGNKKKMTRAHSKHALGENHCSPLCRAIMESDGFMPLDESALTKQGNQAWVTYTTATCLQGN